MPEIEISDATVVAFVEEQRRVFTTIGTTTPDGGVLRAIDQALLAGLRAAIAQHLAEQAGALVGAADLVTVLNQRLGHCHRRPGVWDDDNGPGVAGTQCRECAARGRLWAALGVEHPGPERRELRAAATGGGPASAGEPKAQQTAAPAKDSGDEANGD